jgi:hypothetical protein
MSIESNEPEYTQNQDSAADLVRAEVEIASGEHEAQTDRQNQIKLATDLYKKFNGENIDLFSHDIRNTIMMSWSEGGEESFSRVYRRLVNDSNFLLHPRLLGNIFNVTVEDIIFYKENKTLPQD